MQDPMTAPLTQLLIDGNFVDAGDGGVIETRNPADGTVIASVAAATERDVDDAVKSARRAFESGSWSERTPAERKSGMLRLADLVEQNAEELAWLDTIDAGKPIVDTTETDLPDVVHVLRWYAELADKDFGKVSPTGPGNLGLTVRQPAGVVAAVLPWNFPANMVSWKLGPALAAGNSVLLKPPELAPLSTLRIAQLALEAGIPEGVVNVVPGHGEVAGQALGLHPEVDVVAFTGSTEVGRAFLRYAAASNIKRVVLEMGGKSPQIVMPDAMRDPTRVAEQLALAGFWNGGQNCTCGSRILVHQDQQADLVEALLAATKEWTVGDPTSRETRIGPLIEPSAVDRVSSYVEHAADHGCTVQTGGERVLTETGGWYYAPTVLTGVTNDMKIAREEVFGPVVGVLTYSTEEEAIRIANDSPYGLQASVYTHDLDVAMRVSRQVRAGTVSVNCFSEGDISTPFGGWKQSGFGGHDNGVEALDQYTELKAIWMELRS